MFFFFLSHLVKKTTYGTKYLVLGIAGPGSYGGHQTPAFWERNKKNIYKVIYLLYKMLKIQSWFRVAFSTILTRYGSTRSLVLILYASSKHQTQLFSGNQATSMYIILSILRTASISRSKCYSIVTFLMSCTVFAFKRLIHKLS